MRRGEVILCKRAEKIEAQVFRRGGRDLGHPAQWFFGGRWYYPPVTMFGIPIEDIDYSALIGFLEAGAREGFALDFKRDFPTNLEKSLAAFANTYGGLILIGIEETTVGAPQLPVRGVDLKSGLRERVLQIGLDAVYPPILPEIHVIEFKSDESLPEPDKAVVVVRVHESENAPHAVENRTTVYLRADNVSDRYRKATIGELEWLINKRQRSFELKAQMLESATRRAAQIQWWRRHRGGPGNYRDESTMRLWTVPTFPRWPLLETRELVCITKSAQVSVQSIAPSTLPEGTMQRIAGGVSYAGQFGSSEFQQQGLIFHEFEYWWDSAGASTSHGARQLLPGVTATLILGSLELSRQIYRQAGYSGLVDFRFEANGPSGAFFAEHVEALVSGVTKLVDSQVTAERRFTLGELEDRLFEIAQDCQREIYWAFGIDAEQRLLNRGFPPQQ
jgi:hypothetical protein